MCAARSRKEPVVICTQQALINWLTSGQSPLGEDVKGAVIFINYTRKWISIDPTWGCTRTLLNSDAEKLIAAGWTDDNFRTKTVDDIPDTVLGYVLSLLPECWVLLARSNDRVCLPCGIAPPVVNSGFKRRLEGLVKDMQVLEAYKKRFLQENQCAYLLIVLSGLCIRVD